MPTTWCLHFGSDPHERVACKGSRGYLDSNLCSLLLGGTHQVALLGVEGGHGVQGPARPVVGGLEQLLSNFLSHLCLLAG